MTRVRRIGWSSTKLFVNTLYRCRFRWFCSQKKCGSICRRYSSGAREFHREGYPGCAGSLQEKFPSAEKSLDQGTAGPSESFPEPVRPCRTGWAGPLVSSGISLSVRRWVPLKVSRLRPGSTGLGKTLDEAHPFQPCHRGLELMRALEGV
jgi:hypothetical protein